MKTQIILCRGKAALLLAGIAADLFLMVAFLSSGRQDAVLVGGLMAFLMVYALGMSFSQLRRWPRPSSRG